MPTNVNRTIVLASRPEGALTEKNFAFKESPIPQPRNGEVLIRSLYISVDPYMRGRMNDRPSYIPPFQINAPLTGSIVGKVVESKTPDFKVGDYVQGFLEWADYSVAKREDLHKLDPNNAPITTSLGVLGMPGMTAYFGLLDIGKPKAGETVVISGAAGSVGTTVGQIAKIHGCRVVGIAGTEEKLKYLTQELGFDAAVNYKNAGYVDELKKACPSGVDIYFDNVGGEITDNVLKMINKHARISLCGLISMYNKDKPEEGPRNWWMLLTKSAMVKGFIVSDYKTHFPEALQQMTKWLKDKKIKYKETFVEGFENTPKALIGLFKGDNIGKQIVKVENH